MLITEWINYCTNYEMWDAIIYILSKISKVQPLKSISQFILHSNGHVVTCPYGAWWRHPMETFSTLLALCAGNSPITGEFLSQRPVTRSFDVFFDLCLNKPLSKQSCGWWFKTSSHPLWRHCNGLRLIQFFVTFDVAINFFQGTIITVANIIKME